MTMGDRIAVMRDGGLQQIGDVRSVYEQPESAFIARFMGAANVLPVAALAPDGSGWRATLAGGLQVILAEALAPAGTRGAVVVRQEAIAMGAEAEGLANRFEGRITDSTYLGVQTRLRVAIAPDLELGVWLPARYGGAILRPGETVTIGWPAEAARLVPA